MIAVFVAVLRCDFRLYQPPFEKAKVNACRTSIRVEGPLLIQPVAGLFFCGGLNTTKGRSQR